jgi:hypothetical protein
VDIAQNTETDRLNALRTSAKGWHGVQLAVLGFIGLCGVLQRIGEEGTPRTLQLIAGALVLTALVLACTSTALIASVAWPLYGTDAGSRHVTTEEQSVRASGLRLRAGIALTFVAVSLVALATTSGWWPRPAAGAPLVEVTTRTAVVCGEVSSGHFGELALDVAGRRVVLDLRDVVSIAGTTSCP